MAVDAVKRILKTEKNAVVGGIFPLYTKMIATLGTTSGGDIKESKYFKTNLTLKTIVY